MKKVNKAVIAAAERLYRLSDDDAGSGLFDAVRALRADRAARQAQSKHITEEPPVGSRVRDKDGDIWTRTSSSRYSWCMSLRHERQDAPWGVVLDFRPLTLLCRNCGRESHGMICGGMPQ